jgi:HK97 family phage major capsid protein
MVATSRRSLLDNPGRSNGFTRDVRDLDTVGSDELPGTYRHYQGLMRREFGAERIPGLHDIIAGAFGMTQCTDDNTRRKLAGALERTMTGISGSVAGFAIAPGMTADVWDQARTVDGPWARCNWEPVKNREEWIPVSGEASLALQPPGAAVKNQGIQATWGLSEVVMPTPTDDKLEQLLTIQNRLLIQSIVSRDVASDAQRVLRWLRYRGFRAIRLALELAMIYGIGNGPQGVLTAPSTIFVTRSGTTPSIIDIDAMTASLYVGCLPGACWHCGNDVLKAVDALAVSGQYPEVQYRRPGGMPDGVRLTIKGIPVVPLETSPPAGNTGDLILVDWTQYVLTFLQRSAMDSPLSFGFAPPRDNYHLGMVGMREDAIDALVSEHNLFDTDRLMLNFKFRGDGNFLWPNTKTTGSLLTVGPAVVLK